MNSIVLVEFGNLFDLAHHHDHGRGAAEQAILCSEVILPGGNKVGDALLEELAVDLDLGHRDDARANSSDKIEEEREQEMIVMTRKKGMSR